MPNPFDPFGLSEPNPAVIPTPFEPIVQDWGQLWQVGMGMLGGTQGRLPQIPNAFHVPYGADPITAALADVNRSATQGSRSYAYGLDEEAFSRNFTTIVGGVVAQFGGKISPEQIPAIYKAASIVAQYGEMGLGIAEQLMAADGDAGTGKLVVSALRQGFESLYGPSGARVPLYSAISNLGDNIPLDQRDALFMSIMREVSPVNGKVPGGFTNRQAASIISSAASMGYNVLNDIDTDISRELANDYMNNYMATWNFDNLDKEQTDQITRLSNIQTGETFGQLAEAGNLTQALNNTITQGVSTSEERAGRLAAKNQFSRFLDVTNRLQSISDYKGKAPKTFKELTSLREDIEKRANDAKDAKQRSFYNNLLSDIDTIDKNVGKEYQEINVRKELKNAKNYQREQLTKIAQDKNIYSGDPEAQKKFVEAMIKREELAAYGITNLDALAEDDQWKTFLQNANDEERAALEAYYGAGGLHKAYTEGKQTISGQNFNKTYNLLKQYQDAKTPEEKQALLDSSPELQSYIKDLDVQFQAQQVGERMHKLLKPGSIIQTALAESGTPIQDQQLAAFINKITYGGYSNMDASSLATIVEQVGSGMIDSGASGNDVMQMAGRGAEAAMSVGGNAQAGAINAMRAGLAARAVAKTMAHMDPSKAQEVATRAAGMSTKSLVERTYSALSSYLSDLDISEDNKYSTILNKIKNNENLTTEELNTLYRNSADIMSSVGMSTEMQHSLLNATIDNEAATRNGAAWLMFSTEAQDSMRDNIIRSLGTMEGDVNLSQETREVIASDESKKDIANAVLFNLQDIKDLGILTKPERAEEYKEQLKKKNPQMADKIDAIPAKYLQLMGNRSLEDESKRNNQSPEETLIGIQLAGKVPEAQLVQERMAALRSITPDVVSNTFGNFVDALTKKGGSLEKALSTVATSISSGTLNPKEQEALFYNMATATLTDPKLALQAGITNEDTLAAQNMFKEIYDKAGNDTEVIAKIHKYLRGDLKEDEVNSLNATQKERFYNAKAYLDQDGNKEKLTGIIETGTSKLREKFNGGEEITLSGNKVPAIEDSTTEGTVTPSGESGSPGTTATPAEPGSGTTANNADDKSADPKKVSLVKIDENQFKQLLTLKPDSTPSPTV